MTDATKQAANGQVTPELVAAALKGIKRIDQGKFELWEIEDLEDAIGHTVAEYFNDPAPPMRFMRGLLWLRIRRDHPQVTFDDLRTVNLDALEAAFSSPVEDEGLDPTGDGSSETSDGKPAPEPSPISLASATSGG